MSGREPFVKLIHVEIALPGPRLVLFDQESPEEAVGRCDTGEDPDHPLPSADLLIQALLHVRGTQPPAVLLGESHHAHGVLETFLETGDGFGGDRLKARDEGGRLPTGLLEIGGLEDPLGVGGRLRPVTARGMPEKVTQEMDSGALPGDPLERLASRLDQTRVTVRDDPQDPFQAALFQPLEEVLPGGEGLRVPDREAQDLPHPVVTDPRGDEGRFRHHPVVFAHGELQGVDQDERLRGRQTTLVERPDSGFELGAKGAHGRLREGGPAQGLGDLGHLAGRDAVDDHLHEGRHKGLLATLIALEDLGREAAVPRLGNPSGHGADPGVEGSGAALLR